MPKTPLNKLIAYHWNADRTAIKCRVCLEYKDPESFDRNINKPHRDCRDSRCKACKAAYWKNRKMQRYKADPLRRVLVERLAGAKERCKKSNNFIDLELKDLQDLWEAQEGLCALTGFQMSHVMGKGRVPTNVSIDRKDSTMGYTKDNIQLVCMAVNQMKSDLEMDELLRFCTGILANARKWKKG